MKSLVESLWDRLRNETDLCRKVRRPLRTSRHFAKLVSADNSDFIYPETKMFWEEEKKLGETRDETIDSYVSSNKLNEILELPYTLQELWGGNRRLIEYFCRDDVLTELANTALRPKIDHSQPLKNHYKLSNACVEILTLRNNNEITNAFLDCDDALEPVKTFFDDNPSRNHLVCGFYMRIVQHLFHRSLLKTLDIMSECDFISNCTSNLHMGAISELLQNIVWIPEVADDFLKIKKWYVKENLCTKIVDMLEPSQPECVHENIMELYTNLVRNTRDQMYALDVQSDVLNDELQSEKLISTLTAKIFQRDKNGAVYSSMVRNICEILICLLSSNHILYRPSHTLYKEFNAEVPWVGGNPSAGLDGVLGEGGKNAERSWCPDSSRVAETVIVKAVAKMVQLVIEEMERNQSPSNQDWFYIMRVIIELCDTNHLPTHEALVEQFKNCDIRKLFLSVWNHRNCSIFHGLLQRVVSFILFTHADKPSPLIAYLLKDVNLLAMIRDGISPVCVLRRIDLYSMRAHHVHLALSIEQARKTSGDKAAIEDLLKECPFWQDVVDKLEEWQSWNLPDPEVASARPSLPGDNFGAEVMDDFEREIGAPQQHMLNEFKSQTVSVPMTDVFDTALGELQVSSETKGFSIHPMRVCKVDMDLEENDVDESKFEAMCSTKKCSLLDEWPTQNDQSAGDNWPEMKRSNGTAFDWPGNSQSTKPEGTNFFPVQWDKAPTSDNSSEGEWACFPQDTSTPKKVEEDDEWADFSSARANESLGSNRFSDWPGVDAEITNASNAKHSDPANPVTSGLATGVMGTSLEKNALNQSEC